MSMVRGLLQTLWRQMGGGMLISYLISYIITYF